MTLYAVQPDPVTGSLDDAKVISQSQHGWDFLEQAIMLWRLVDTTRAAKVEAVLDRVAKLAGDGELRIEAQDLRELVRLLTGVDEAIVAAGIVDHHWRIPPEHLNDLAKQVPAMDLKTERSLDDKTHALGEVMINAFSVRNFLEKAADAGCVVVLG